MKTENVQMSVHRQVSLVEEMGVVKKPSLSNLVSCFEVS